MVVPYPKRVLRFSYGVVGSLACLGLAPLAAGALSPRFTLVFGVVFWVVGTATSASVPAELLSRIESGLVRTIVAPFAVGLTGLLTGAVAVLLALVLPNGADMVRVIGMGVYMSFLMSALLGVFVGVPVQLLIELVARVLRQRP